MWDNWLLAITAQTKLKFEFKSVYLIAFGAAVPENSTDCGSFMMETLPCIKEAMYVGMPNDTDPLNGEFKKFCV